MSEPKQTRKRMWDLKQRAEDAGTLDLYIYGDVAGDSQDWWTGEVIQSETSANALRDALAEYPDAKEIAIYINSYGGSVFEGTAIYNQLKRHSAHKTVYVDGFACSIASVIAMAGDTVVMPRNALMMIHNMSMGFYGTAAELRQAAENLDTINQAGMAAYLEKAGDKLDPEKLKKMYDAETWLTAEQCMTLGLADQYAETDADMSKAAEILQKANLTLEQRINVQKSLAAQLRQLTTAPAAAPLPHDSPAPQEPQQKNRIMSLFG